MIISASRRTDIPTYYSKWFFNRLQERYVLVRNPMNVHQVSRIDLSPEVIDGIVFWTKNPIPMFPRLAELDPYTYYFQFTLNAYGKDLEPNVPSKNNTIIPAFKDLSSRIGKERVVWRYDPVLLNNTYTMEYHCKYFAKLASILSPYTEKCTVSFIDLYDKTIRNTAALGVKEPSFEQKQELLFYFARSAEAVGIYIDTCSEAGVFGNFHVQTASCVDKARLERIGHYTLSVGKDKNQRAECGCVESIDIGEYNTCRNGCLYCYANFNNELALERFKQHDPTSPLLLGGELGLDKVNFRQVSSLRETSANFGLLDQIEESK